MKSLYFNSSLADLNGIEVNTNVTFYYITKAQTEEDRYQRNLYRKARY